MCWRLYCKTVIDFLHLSCSRDEVVRRSPSKCGREVESGGIAFNRCGLWWADPIVDAVVAVILMKQTSARLNSCKNALISVTSWVKRIVTMVAEPAFAGGQPYLRPVMNAFCWCLLRVVRVHASCPTRFSLIKVVVRVLQSSLSAHTATFAHVYSRSAVYRSLRDNAPSSPPSSRSSIKFHSVAFRIPFLT